MKTNSFSVFLSNTFLIMNLPILLFGVGGTEIIFIIFIIVLLFGADKVPEIARGLAKGIKTVKNATTDITSEITRSAEEQFNESGGEEIKKEIKSVKEDIEEISGTIKRKNPFS